MFKDLSNNIFLGLTGDINIDWWKKLDEIKYFNIEEVAVFLGRFDRKERNHLFKFLLKSNIKKIPLVHIRHDMDCDEIKFFIDNYSTECFNIHEDHFDFLDKWERYYDKLYLEMNKDDIVDKNVKVEKIGGFCIDLAHFKSALAKGTKEAYYAFSKKNEVKFKCNHISGFLEQEKTDSHFIKNIEEFNYLNTLPKYVFSEIMAIEVDNSIEGQMKFKEYIVKLLSEYLS